MLHLTWRGYLIPKNLAVCFPEIHDGLVSFLEREREREREEKHTTRYSRLTTPAAA